MNDKKLVIDHDCVDHMINMYDHNLDSGLANNFPALQDCWENADPIPFCKLCKDVCGIADYHDSANIDYSNWKI